MVPFHVNGVRALSVWNAIKMSKLRICAVIAAQFKRFKCFGCPTLHDHFRCSRRKRKKFSRRMPSMSAAE